MASNETLDMIQEEVVSPSFRKCPLPILDLERDVQTP